MHIPLFLCLVVVIGLTAAVPHAFVGSHPVTPIRFPVQNVTNSSFTIPHWLGMLVATGLSADANWNLPPSYANGGSVMPGQMLMVRNYASWNVLLTPAVDEWVDGLPEYEIAPSEGAVFIAVDNGYIAVAELAF